VERTLPVGSDNQYVQQVLRLSPLQAHKARKRKRRMWSTWSESAKSSITSALEKTGDVISKAATNARHLGENASTSPGIPPANESDGSDAPNAPAEAYTTGRSSEEEEGGAAASASGKPQAELLLKNLQVGWTSVVESTKAGIKVAQFKLEEEQHRLTERLHKARSAYYRRDLELPLDVAALKDAEVVYLTDRLITLSHPAAPSATHPEIITAERKLAAVGHLLQKRHGGRFMVWNLSEVEYDIGILDDQVLTFSFPGSPSPPLGLLLKLLISMESWLKADDRNVAVVHCLTGKGRTSTVMAAFLCWMGEAGFCDVHEALAYIAACKQVPPDDLTIPSQRRYASYFKNMLDSVRPSQPPLLLKRVIMSEAPRFARGPPLEDRKRDGDTSAPSSGKSTPTKPLNAAAGGDEEAQRMGCAPYLQIFKAGKLLHTSPASLSAQPPPDSDSNELTFCQVADGSVSFHINQIVQGDILIRCRHLTTHRQRISMFRAAFHTGYVPPKVMRLTKSQLDGACNDPRFPEDFFLDVIFEAVDAETASKVLQDSAAASKEEGTEGKEETSATPAVKSSGSEQAKLLAGGSTTVQASAYDTMLHRDSRFWEVIAARRELHSKDQSKASIGGSEDPTWGPTVGRRRDFAAKKKSGGGTSGRASASSPQSKEKVEALETFSIGAELDFLPESADKDRGAPSDVTKSKQPKKDSLMEALMGALTDDEDSGMEDSEEIVFDGEADNEPTQSSSHGISAVEPTPTIVELPPLPSSDEKAVLSSIQDAEQGATVALDSGTTDDNVAASNPPSSSSSQANALDVKSDALDDDIDALLTSGMEDLDLDIGDEDLLAVDDADLEDMESFLASGSARTQP
jgi:C2 domain of PTEN tumour-suppressor protein